MSFAAGMAAGMGGGIGVGIAIGTSSGEKQARDKLCSTSRVRGSRCRTSRGSKS